MDTDTHKRHTQRPTDKQKRKKGKINMFECTHMAKANRNLFVLVIFSYITSQPFSKLKQVHISQGQSFNNWMERLWRCWNKIRKITVIFNIYKCFKVIMHFIFWVVFHIKYMKY